MYQWLIDLLGIVPTENERMIIIAVLCVVVLLAVDVLFRFIFAPVVALMSGSGRRL